MMSSFSWTIISLPVVLQEVRVLHKEDPVVLTIVLDQMRDRLHLLRVIIPKNLLTTKKANINKTLKIQQK